MKGRRDVRRHVRATGTDMPDLGQLHDSFFKSTFAHIEVAADFLGHYLPAPVVAVLDMDTLALAPGSWGLAQTS